MTARKPFREESPKGVRVYRVAPGWVELRWREILVKRLAESSGGESCDRPAEPHGLARRHPARPAGEAWRGSRPRSPLAAPRAASITGMEHTIDGGTGAHC